MTYYETTLVSQMIGTVFFPYVMKEIEFINWVHYISINQILFYLVQLLYGLWYKEPNWYVIQMSLREKCPNT